MTKPAHLHPADLHGIARLATDATGAVTDIVEAMHDVIASPWFRAIPGASEVAGLAYSSVRGVAQMVGTGLDRAAVPILPRFRERESSPQRDALLSILNGVIGDHLMATANPLSLPMEFRRRGRALVLEREQLGSSLPRISPRIALMIHGLCGTDGQWKGAETDYTIALERDFGFTPVFLRYNSGLHISTNGRALAELLEVLVGEWPVPVEELLIVGHSMGGLVARSAVHYGRVRGARWTSLVRRMAFLGSPHHGAPLERGGNWFEQLIGSIPVAAPLSRLGRLRSAGVTDLRHGNLLDDDWCDSDRFSKSHDCRLPLPLPEGIDCLAVAATTGERTGDARDRLVGDGLVPVRSALGDHVGKERALAFAESRRAVVYRTHHMGLLGKPEVEEILGRWLGDELATVAV
jgi:pimeloyl-ACP methyl ester carboxylesterase